MGADRALLRAPSTRWGASADLLEVCREGRFVILPRAAARPLVLEGTAADVWQIVRTGATVDEVCDALCETYSAPTASVRAPVVAMIDRLRDAGAVTEAGAG